MTRNLEPYWKDRGGPMRPTHESIYNEGHAVAFMALLARFGGSVTLSRDELAETRGTIHRSEDLNGAVTYSIAKPER